MPSFTTVYRAVVMIAIGAIVVKGWQLYGPSADQVKSAAVSAMDMAQAAMKNSQSPNAEAHSAADRGGSAPPFATTTQAETANSAAPATPSLIPTNNTGSLPVAVSPTPSFSQTMEPTTPSGEKTTQASAANDTRLPALLSRLERLGVAEPKLAPWGSSGHLYRFCCQAAWKDSPAFTQHFESVADEPAQAVEQVVAKVEAWRTAQRSGDPLR